MIKNFTILTIIVALALTSAQATTYTVSKLIDCDTGEEIAHVMGSYQISSGTDINEFIERYEKPTGHYEVDYNGEDKFAEMKYDNIWKQLTPHHVDSCPKTDDTNDDFNDDFEEYKNTRNKHKFIEDKQKHFEANKPAANNNTKSHNQGNNDMKKTLIAGAAAIGIATSPALATVHIPASNGIPAVTGEYVNGDYIYTFDGNTYKSQAEAEDANWDAHQILKASSQADINYNTDSNVHVVAKSGKGFSSITNAIAHKQEGEIKVLEAQAESGGEHHYWFDWTTWTFKVTGTDISVATIEGAIAMVNAQTAQDEQTVEEGSKTPEQAAEDNAKANEEVEQANEEANEEIEEEAQREQDVENERIAAEEARNNAEAARAAAKAMYNRKLRAFENDVRDDLDARAALAFEQEGFLFEIKPTAGALSVSKQFMLNGAADDLAEFTDGQVLANLYFTPKMTVMGIGKGYAGASISADLEGRTANNFIGGLNTGEHYVAHKNGMDINGKTDATAYIGYDDGKRRVTIDNDGHVKARFTFTF